jgi:hypothetical protein
MIDFEQALHDPAGIFEKPMHVVEEASLTREQKIAILNEWEIDAEALLRADEENMQMDEPSMLSRVHRALAMLADD